MKDIKKNKFVFCNIFEAIFSLGNENKIGVRLSTNLQLCGALGKEGFMGRGREIHEFRLFY